MAAIMEPPGPPPSPGGTKQIGLEIKEGEVIAYVLNRETGKVETETYKVVEHQPAAILVIGTKQKVEAEQEEKSDYTRVVIPQETDYPASWYEQVFIRTTRSFVVNVPGTDKPLKMSGKRVTMLSPSAYGNSIPPLTWSQAYDPTDIRIAEVSLVPAGD